MRSGWVGRGVTDEKGGPGKGGSGPPPSGYAPAYSIKPMRFKLLKVGQDSYYAVYLIYIYSISFAFKCRMKRYTKFDLLTMFLKSATSHKITHVLQYS